MEEVSFEKKFFDLSPTPYLCLKVVFGADKTPIDVMIVQTNASFAAMMGERKSQFLGRSVFDTLLRNRDASDTGGNLIEVLEGKRILVKDMHSLHLDRWFRIKAFGIGDGMIGAAILDVTTEYAQEFGLTQFMNLSREMMCISDTDGRFLKVNQRFAETLGYDPSDLEGIYYMSLVASEDKERTEEAMSKMIREKEIPSFTNRYLCKDGTYRYMDWHSWVQEKYVFSSARDVTAQHEKTSELKRMANTDPLTGLYNRNYYDRHIMGLIERADLSDLPLSMISLDLDHFKNVNDTWGHAAGDEVLKETGRIMRETVRKSDIVVRIGGEEFLVILPNTDAGAALSAAQKLKESFEKFSHPTAGTVTASLGVAEKCRTESYEDWYKRADAGVYSAKRSGRNCVVYLEKSPDEQMKREKLVWNPAWNSGNRTIDDEHKELLKLGNKIIEMAGQEHSFEKAMPYLDDVIHHVEAHFRHELQILARIGYPGYDEHARIHSELIEQIRFLRESYLETKVRSAAFFSFIVEDVILDHLIKEDAKFFIYTKDRAGKQDQE